MSTVDQFIKGNETYVKNLDETRKNLPLQLPVRKARLLVLIRSLRMILIMVTLRRGLL